MQLRFTHLAELREAAYVRIFARFVNFAAVRPVIDKNKK